MFDKIKNFLSYSNLKKDLKLMIEKEHTQKNEDY